MNGAGQFLMHLYQQGEARKEQEKQDASKANVLRKALSLYQPEQKDVFATMSKDDLEGTMMKFVLDKQKQEMDFNAQRLAEAQRQNTAASAFEQVIAETGRMNPAESLGLGLGPIQPPAVQPSFERALTALSRHPQAANASGLDNFLRLLEGNGQQANTFFKPGAAPEAFPQLPGWYRVATGPNAGQLVYSPTSTDNIQATPVTDAQGNVLAQTIPTRNGPQPLRTPTGITDKDRFNALQSEKRALIAAKGKSILKDSQAGYDTAIAAIDAELEKLQLAGTTSTSSQKKSEYASADDVRAAVTSGKLDRAKAIEILRQQFGMK